MNEFFGMTYERLDEIQGQIRAIGESLDPLKEQIKERCGQWATGAGGETEEDAQLIAAGGLLSRLEQALFETDFWIQGVRAYMDAEALDLGTCDRISAIVIEAYGGFRDPDDLYGVRRQERMLEQVLGDLGLSVELLGGGIVTVTTRKEEAPAPDPAA